MKIKDSTLDKLGDIYTTVAAIYVAVAVALLVGYGVAALIPDRADAQEAGSVEDRLWTLEHRYDAFVQNTELEFKLHADTILRLQERLDDQERVIRRLCRKTDLARCL